MDFESKIKDKMNGMSMAPSSDIMSKVRQKRTPLYVMKNHIGLHKLRYATISIVVLALFIGPIIWDNTEDDLSNYTQTENNEIQNESIEGNELIINGKDLATLDKDLNEEVDQGFAKNEESKKGQGELTLNKNAETSRQKNRIKRNRKSQNNTTNTQKSIVAKKENHVLNPLKDDKVDESLANTDLSNFNKKREEKLAQWKNVSVNSFADNYSEIKSLEIDYVQESSEEHEVDNDFDISAKVRMRYIGVGAGIYGQSLYAENNVAGNNFKNATSYKMTYSYGLNVGFNLSNKWILQTGVEMFQRDLNFDYFAESQNKVLHIDTVVGVVHIPGSPDKKVTRYDSTYVNDGKHKKINSINSTSFIEIPVAFSYRVWSNRNFSIGVNPGLRLGFLQSTTGHSFAKSGALENMNEEGATSTYRSLNVSADLGLDVECRLTRKLNVFCQPKVRKGFGPLMESGSGFSHNYTTFGIFGGLRMNL